MPYLTKNRELDALREYLEKAGADGSVKKAIIQFASKFFDMRKDLLKSENASNSIDLEGSARIIADFWGPMSALSAWLIHKNEKSCHTFFLSFYWVNEPIKQVELSESLKAELIFHIIKTNIEKGLLKRKKAPSYFENTLFRILYREPKPRMNNSDFSFLSGIKLHIPYFTSLDKCLGIYDILGQADKAGIESAAGAISTINIHYFNKQDTFNEDDINDVIQALRRLDLSEDLVGVVSNFLITKLKNRQAQKPFPKQTDAAPTTIDSAASSYTVKITESYRKLKTLYNIEENLATRYLNFDEILRCVELAYEIDMDETLKEQMLINIRRYNRDNNGAIDLLNEANLYISNLSEVESLSESLGNLSEACTVHSNDHSKESRDKLALALASVLKGCTPDMLLQVIEYKKDPSQFNI